MIRLTAEFWVQAYLQRLNLANIPAFVTQKGDLTAGVVWVKLNTLDGNAEIYQRSFDLQTGERAWVCALKAPEAEIDAYLSKQKSFDSDMWVIEVENRHGQHLLDDPGLS